MKLLCTLLKSYSELLYFFFCDTTSIAFLLLFINVGFGITMNSTGYFITYVCLQLLVMIFSFNDNKGEYRSLVLQSEIKSILENGITVLNV